MADDKRESPAYRVLSSGGVRALAVIEAQIRGRDCCKISREEFGRLDSLSRSAMSFAVAQLTVLGFVTVEVGPRNCHIFRLSEVWRTVDADQAARLRASAPRRRPSKQMTRSVPTFPTPVRISR
jgi:hypothetical protein